MARGDEACQLACPTAIARCGENPFVSRFEIAFGFEAKRGDGTVARLAPKEENVNVFRHARHKRPYSAGTEEQRLPHLVMTKLLDTWRAVRVVENYLGQEHVF